MALRGDHAGDEVRSYPTGGVMTARARHAALPPTLAPRGLSRTEAAAFVGVSPTTFDKLVADGRMPRPKAIDARRVWDRVEVERAFGSLPTVGGDGSVAGDENPWD